jgi:Head domain of trimeric autotransporter adhesin
MKLVNYSIILASVSAMAISVSAAAQTVQPPQVPLGDANCQQGQLPIFPSCTTPGTRTTAPAIVTATPFDANSTLLNATQNVTYAGDLVIAGGAVTINPIFGQFSFGPESFFVPDSATVNVNSNYDGGVKFAVPNAAAPFFQNLLTTSTIGGFQTYQFNSNVVNSIGVNIKNALFSDKSSGIDYNFSLSTPNPTALVGGNSTALAGRFISDPNTGGPLTFGTLTGNATVLTANPDAIFTPSGIFLDANGQPRGGWISPYALQYNVTAAVTTTLDETGLVTPTVSVTNGINMNGSVITNLASGVNATDAVNRGVTAAATAQTTATSALANAAAAQATANTGVSNAAAAQTTANTGVANAATAQTTANTAVANAASAQSTANTAVTSAAAAQTTANTALTLATNTAALINTGAAGNQVAIGSGSTATTGKAVSIGYLNTASGNGAVAIGDPNVATGTGAVAIGADNTATGQGAVALGNLSVANGQSAVALGDTANAAAAGAVAIGQSAAATFAGSAAVGATAATTRANQVKLGGAASSVTVGDIAASTAAQAGPTDVATVDASGTIGRDTTIRPAIVSLQATQTSQGSAIAALQLVNNSARLSAIEAGQVNLFNLSEVNRKQANRGIAAVAAMTTAHFPSEPGKTSYAANVATYRGEVGYSISLAHRFSGANSFALTAGLSHSGSDDTAARVGVAGEF